jgi:hypothetical protein
VLETPKKKRARKEKQKVVSLVDVSARRNTRSCTKKGGYKLLPMMDKPKPRKKPRSIKPKGKTVRYHLVLQLRCCSRL